MRKTKEKSRHGLSDESILDLFYARSEQALTEARFKYDPALSALAARFLCDERDREEALNDAYLAAWESIPPHRPASLAAFLTALTRRKAIDRLRKNTARREPPAACLSALDELEEILPAKDLPEDELLAKELAAIISDYLAGVSPRARFIFMCRYFEACSVKEISRALSVSVSTVEKELKTLRDGLRARLINEGYLL